MTVSQHSEMQDVANRLALDAGEWIVRYTRTRVSAVHIEAKVEVVWSEHVTIAENGALWPGYRLKVRLIPRSGAGDRVGLYGE